MRLWPFRRKPKELPPLTGDWCSTCQCDLRRGEVWEVHTGHEAAEDGQGGTYLAKTYCRRHKPRRARHLKA